ncbi:ABC transporter permease subunit [Psychromonas sp. KJ10-10]|uniref:ABC transporter permease subunit n=1 Tax=Psychromonas sp. KJ10-10 TaxID=3391823 RepID=UPI0039B3D86D
MPAVTLALCALAPIARMTRSSMITALGSEYVKATKANGIKSSVRIYVYALQNASLPLLTVIGLVFGFLLGGNVLVEKVYSWPGVGSFAIDALVASDYCCDSRVCTDYGRTIRYFKFNYRHSIYTF